MLLLKLKFISMNIMRKIKQYKDAEYTSTYFTTVVPQVLDLRIQLFRSYSSWTL